jgi:hypothetical protein
MFLIIAFRKSFKNVTLVPFLKLFANFLFKIISKEVRIHFLAHFSIGYIFTYATFLIASTSGKFG